MSNSYDALAFYVYIICEEGVWIVMIILDHQDFMTVRHHYYYPYFGYILICSL
jgi:hypothetical protein